MPAEDHRGADLAADENRALRRGWWSFGPRPRYWLTRFALLRGLGFIYLVAFFSLSQQLVPLLGADGLTPVVAFLDRVASLRPDGLERAWQVPSLFWLGASDAVLVGCAWVGVGLSVLLLMGLANVPLLVALWALYTSFVNVGQVWYGYGWETLLLEAGFLAIFLVPPLDPRPWSGATPPPRQVVWLFRWLVFRVMFGAGLIKMRGDPCWTELTCLAHHYETQPNPNPLSYYLHAAPLWFHELGVLFNHGVELIAPWFVFGPRRARHVAGGLIVAFQAALILSGNLSFLNWLTLVVALACFDDAAWARLLPRPARDRVRAWNAPGGHEVEPSKAREGVSWALVILVGILSMNPVVNMLSRDQWMNASYDPLRLVNTYGAFGTVGKVRHEVIIEGTSDPRPGPDTEWKEYEFPCKPGDPERRPCVVTPYHHRLDWQMWFAALGDVRREPWTAQLAYKLLEGDPSVKPLFTHDPFPDPDRPPRFVRMSLWRYAFTDPSADTDAWWRRERLEEAFLHPVHLDHPAFRRFLEAHGWLRD
ncbi:MAG: lipase maturation factor family protein [Myxococcota bacterium]